MKLTAIGNVILSLPNYGNFNWPKTDNNLTRHARSGKQQILCNELTPGTTTKTTETTEITTM